MEYQHSPIEPNGCLKLLGHCADKCHRRTVAGSMIGFLFTFGLCVLLLSCGTNPNPSGPQYPDRTRTGPGESEQGPTPVPRPIHPSANAPPGVGLEKVN